MKLMAKDKDIEKLTKVEMREKRRGMRKRAEIDNREKVDGVVK